MISDYPTFTPLESKHRKIVKGLTAKFDPYSDFDFTSLASWNTDGSTGISMLNGNLVIKMSDYVTHEQLLSILGNSKLDETLVGILHTVPELKLVPEVVVRNIKDKSKFIITEDQDNFDYILNIEKIATLAGGEFKKKRNKVHQVSKDLGDVLRTQNITVLSDQNIKEITNLFDEWAVAKSELSEDTKAEKIALSRLLEYRHDMNLVVTLVRLNGKLVGFSVNELLDDGYAICHFEKALSAHQYFYTFLVNQAAKALWQHGAKYVNWEQDLGMPGLRKSKASYCPDSFLKKYTISAVNR